jgi:hypothetical protein
MQESSPGFATLMRILAQTLLWKQECQFRVVFIRDADISYITYLFAIVSRSPHFNLPHPRYISHHSAIICTHQVTIAMAPLVSIIPQGSKAHERSLIPLSADFGATILDDVANFTVTHTFYNDCRHSLPLAEFIFPLQPGFAILDFSCAFGGDAGEDKIMRATVMEKVAARSNFAKAQAEGKTPALLEQNAKDMFRSAISNMPAKYNKIFFI